MINAADAMKLIFSHPAATAGIGGLIGGGGALVYNAFSQPTLDEYGNPIESNDINPLVAAGIGSGVGLVGGMGINYLKGRNPVQPSQAARQTPRNQVMNIEDPWEGETITVVPNYQVRQPNPTAIPNPQLPSGFQELTPQQRVTAARQQMHSDGWDYYASRPVYEGSAKVNLAGWDLVNPSPEGNAWNRELNSDAIRYQKWLESEAIIRGQNQRPQITNNDLFDADGNMILDYPQKKIV